MKDIFGIPIKVGDIALYMPYKDNDSLVKVIGFTAKQVAIQHNSSNSLFSTRFEGYDTKVKSNKLLILSPLVDHYKTNHPEYLL